MAQTASRMTIAPIHPCFGARVEGVDLGEPLDTATFQQIFDAFQEYSVLVSNGQRLADGTQMAFSRRFGPLETTINATGRENRLHPTLVDLSNTDPERDGGLMDWTDRRMLYQSGNQLWHTDSSFKPVPAMASLLSGREVPPVGGETEFASMRHAYRTPPEATRQGLAAKGAGRGTCGGAAAPRRRVGRPPPGGGGARGAPPPVAPPPLGGGGLPPRRRGRGVARPRNRRSGAGFAGAIGLRARAPRVTGGGCW